MPPVSPAQVINDPDFQALSDADRHKFFMAADPDYASAPPDVQTKFLSAIRTQQALGSINPPWVGTPPPAAPDKGVSAPPEFASDATRLHGKVRPFSLAQPGPDQGVPQEPGEDPLGAVYDNARAAGKAAGNYFLGGTQGAARTLLGGGKTLHDVGSMLPDVGSEYAYAQPGEDDVQKNVAEFSNDIKPKNLAQKLGYGTETAAEYAAPGLGEEGLTEKLATKGVPKLISRMAFGAGTNAALENLHGGSKTDQAVAAGIGAAVPAASELGKPVVNRIHEEAPRLMQSVMNVLPKEFRYGRNPAKAVVDEGIKGNDLDDIYNQVNDRYVQRAQAVEQNLQQNAHQQLDLNHHVLDPITHAQELAADQGNEKVFNQLETIKQRLGQKHQMFRMSPNEPPIHFYSGEVPGPTVTARFRNFNMGPVDFSNFTPAEANAFKMRVGEMAKWTPAELQNPDQQAVNSALRQVYHNVNDSIDAAVPGTKLANQRVGELMSAKHALEIAKQKEEGSRSIIPGALQRVIRRGALLGSLGAGAGAAYGATGGRGEAARDALIGATVGGLGELAAEPAMSAVERPGFLSKMAQRAAHFPEADKFLRPAGALGMAAYDTLGQTPPGASHIVYDREGNVIGHMIDGRFVRQYTPNQDQEQP